MDDVNKGVKTRFLSFFLACCSPLGTMVVIFAFGLLYFLSNFSSCFSSLPEKLSFCSSSVFPLVCSLSEDTSTASCYT